MPRTGLWLRVFVGLLLAVLPPILIVVSALLLAGSVFPTADPNVVAVLVVVAALVWAGMLAIVYTRTLTDDIRSLVALAQRGQMADGASTDSAYEGLAAALDERNRQVAQLARQSGLVPIHSDPGQVVAGLVSTVRSVLDDPTWRLAVLAAQDMDLLPPGTYRATGDEPAVEDIGELERWASVAGSDTVARHVEGPWGAFAVVDVSVADRLTGMLYAPWEGRMAPTPADLELLALVGQHAATAIEHSLLYATVRSQADELNRLAAIQADFLRGVTHDLQTPLTSIGAVAAELRADPDVPDRASSDLDTISHQAERLRRMVAQLLVASRLEAGALTPQQEVFSVQPLIERTWAALRANRSFDLDVIGPAHLAIGDPDRFEQVLWAVLDNAVKYSPSGSPIEVRLQPNESELVVTIRDHGTGMDEATRRHAFDQFYRSSSARSLAPDGSGVGLYAARGLMEAMGGRIQVASELGQGSAISLHLPAEPARMERE